MPLSIEKLNKLLYSKGFLPSKYFVINSVCIYIEVISITDAEMFLLYIPSKYKFLVRSPTEPGQGDVYELSYLDPDENNNYSVNQYTGVLDEDIVESSYQDVTGFSGDNIVPYLEEKYKKSIKIRDISIEDSKDANDIVRQLKRLRYCLQNLKYKLAIIRKNVLFSIKRDDSIECYSIKNYIGKDYKKLYVSVDLELLYEKIDCLMSNMNTIKKSIYTILDKNYFTQTTVLNKLLDENTIGNSLRFSSNAYNKKLEYEKYLKESEDMLKSILKSEKLKTEQIVEATHKYKNSNKGLNNDIEKSHCMSKLNNDLTSIQSLKEDIIKTIFDIKNKKDDNVLSVDKIMFDNSVMLDSIFKNFVLLDNIAQ